MTSLPDEYRRFPPKFGVYLNSPDTLIIAQSHDDPNPLHIVTLAPHRKTYSSKAGLFLRLHAKARETSTIIGMADYVSWSSLQILLRVYLVDDVLPTYTPHPPMISWIASMKRPFLLNVVNTLSPQRQFRIRFPGMMDELETFVWKNSGCAEVQALGGCGNGMKLVRQTTNEVVAVWCRPRHGMFSVKKGTMGFCGERFTEEFELAVVMSLLAIVFLEYGT